MGFKEGFFWGGATAANQYEGGYISGGKGLAIQDVITGGDGRNNIPRRMALKLADGSTKFIDRRGTEVPDGAVPYVDEDTYYPSHVATDFYHHRIVILPFYEQIAKARPCQQSCRDGLRVFALL